MEDARDGADDPAHTFLRDGWVVVALPDPSPVLDAAALLLERLRRRWQLPLERLEDYHRHAADARHTEIQYDLAVTYHASRLGRRIVECNLGVVTSLAGPDLHVHRTPYLRVARPGRAGDNIGFHRDTHYGCSAFELSLHVPLVALEPSGALGFVSGSHGERADEDDLVSEVRADVARGSLKHRLGFLRAPKRMSVDVVRRAIRPALAVGDAVVFGLATVHGQDVNRGRVTRFSTDVRVVNSFAPLAWGRSTSLGEFYEPLCASPVTRQALRYEAANPVAEGTPVLTAARDAAVQVLTR